MIDLTLFLLVNLLADEPKPAEPVPFDAAQGKQDPDRPAISLADLKLLRDTNIFAPRSAKRTTPKISKSDRPTRFEPAAPVKPKPPVVTGIFFDPKAETYLVVVEDRNVEPLRQFKEPKFLKSGDEVAGCKVGAVTAEQAVFVHGEASKELRVGDSLPSDDKVSAATVENGEVQPVTETVETKPVDPEAHVRTLEEMRKKVGRKNRPSREE